MISVGFFFWFLSHHQMTPLHLAAESGRIKILKYLADKGADINHQDDNGVITCDHTYTKFGRLADQI